MSVLLLVLAVAIGVVSIWDVGGVVTAMRARLEAMPVLGASHRRLPSWVFRAFGVWCIVFGVAQFIYLSASSPGYSVPLGRIVADANVQNRAYHDTPFRLAAPGTKVAMSADTAAHLVITECNEGPGTRVLVTGLVTGPVTAGSPLYWAVFVDPPGKHIAPSAEPLPKPVILSWIGAFVPVQDSQHPWCDFGSADDLPPLSVFGS